MKTYQVAYWVEGRGYVFHQISAERCEVGSEGELGLFVKEEVVGLFACGHWCWLEVISMEEKEDA